MGKIITPNDPVSVITNPNAVVDSLDLSRQTTKDDLYNAGFKDPNAIYNLRHIIEDLLAGDMSVAKREEYAYLNFEQIKKALEWIMTNDFSDNFKNLLLEKPYLLNFKGKPPTPEEFLTHRYIGEMSQSIWHPVKKNFLEFFDPLKPYRCAVLNPSIGSGKSTFTMLCLLYVICCFGMMRNPWKFFSMAQTSVFATALCAVTLTKASEIYREPIQQLIESSDFWMRCRTAQDLLKEDLYLQQSDYIDHIAWTTSCKSAVLGFSNNMQMKVVSSANSLLGVNILQGAMTEITFFKEAGKGWTDEKIFNFFSKLKERISNRFQNNYYARFILDSSPSTLEDPIQNWMDYDAPENSENFIWKGSRWAIYPEEFPDYITLTNQHQLNEKREFHNNYDVAFQLYKGGNGKPPVACINEVQASQYNPEDLIWCPIKQVTKKGVANFLNKAKENPIEFMKDWAGLPAGMPDRLFYRNDWIEDCFDNGLRNIYGAVIALADQEPEHLIWNQVYDKFFYKVMQKNYYYYEPNIPRVISVDQSKSRDCTCIAMSHVELDPERTDDHTKRPLLVYVTDFTIVLIPKGGHINFDAIKFFIMDLKQLGGLNIRHVSFDGYQSEPTKQYLKRMGVTVDYVSVDSDNDPYYTYYDLVTHNRWFCGKNIFAKNNMRALHETRRKQTGTVKIDHFEGELSYDWEDGTWESNTHCGANAKDCLDAVAGNIWLMNMYSSEFIATKKFYPTDTYERNPEKMREKTESFLAKMNLK